MKYRKQFIRVLFFVFLLACLLTGLAGISRVPARAAPRLQAVSPGDVVISEFRTRGPSMGNDEFVEIYNKTTLPIDISGWLIRASNNTGTTGTRYTFPAGILLQSGQHYIVTGTAYSGGVQESPVALLSGTGIADNGGIAITLSDGTTVIDQVGMNINSAYKEGTILIPLSGTSDQSYERKLGGLSDSCQDTGDNFNDFANITPSNPQNSSSPLSLCGVILPTLTSTNTATSTATITLTPSVTNTLPAGTAVPPLTLVINEVAWAGTAASSSDEWIELYNPGSSPVNLTSWILKTDDTSPTIALTGTIPAGGYFLLERTDDTTVSDIIADLIYTGELNNSNEILRLLDPGGNLIDTANSNGGAWPGNSTTLGSLERRGVIPDSETAWITNTGIVRNGLDANGNAINGTPKRANWALTVTPTASVTPSRTRTPLPPPTTTRTPTPLPPPPLIAINEFVPRPGHDWNGDGIVNVGDEYIELLNHGVVDVDLSGYTLDDEVNIGSNPYRLPSVVMKPGERMVFFGSETGLLLGDGGDGVRLLKPNGQLGDAYNYRVVRYPDHTYCRYPDNGGADDWNTNCFPTPGLQNSLSGSFAPPQDEDGAPVDSLCPLSDTQPDDFIWAECQPFGQNIFRPAFWDKTGWFGERYLPKSPGKWPVFVD
jgi:lamin tail-like protein